jgi:hypothetical protein
MVLMVLRCVNSMVRATMSELISFSGTKVVPAFLRTRGSKGAREIRKKTRLRRLRFIRNNINNLVPP